MATNQTAICERGWGPLNFNALKHPEIQLTINGANATTISQITDNMATVDPADLNLSDGYSGSLMDKMVDHRNRESARTGVNKEEQDRKRKETAQAKLDSNKKRFTAGLLAATGNFALGPEVLQNLRERKIASELVNYGKWEKKNNEYMAQLAKVQALRQANKTTAEMNVMELRLLCSWFKRAGDPALPTTRDLLITKLEETMTRGDQAAPPRLLDVTVPDGPAIFI